ncbi:polysaccharide pyruvyl transferase family protein [Leifsonia sp. AG29]|uniref:polysaccharide pyruvyl transferase family protein n=1 Tax=Leifsonia sp. AG29 TaxID=2598860 RepID=UPI00131B1367|nr:polysaccharide pyruvyl transferase family protein [Leifsonia sp. AG29]
MTKRDLIYLGWQGFRNFGDDLLHETWRAALDHPLDVCAPLGRDYLRRAPSVAVARLRGLGRERLVLLGGGTTVGFANWGRNARRALRAYGADALVVAGAGIAARDDAHALSTQEQDWSEWKAIDEVALFGVRGPISAREATDFWRRASIVGDPALLYPRVRPVERPGDPFLGVSIGAGGRTRFDLDALAEAIEELRVLTGVMPVRIFQLADEDATVCEALRDRLGGFRVIRTYRGDVHETMTDLSSAALLISERLHGGVAAVALGVPTVSLAYASKCDDFWRSVAPGTDPVRVGANADDIVAAALSALDEPNRRSTMERVDDLTGRLSAVVGDLAAWLRGDVATQDLAADAGAIAA